MENGHEIQGEVGVISGVSFLWVSPSQLKDLIGTPKERYQWKRRLERIKAKGVTGAPA